MYLKNALFPKIFNPFVPDSDSFGRFWKQFIFQPGCRIQSNFTISTDTCTSNDLSDCTCVSQEAGSQLIFQEGEKILDKFSYKPENFTRNCFCLLALAIGYRFLGYLILSFKFRKANR